MLSRFTPVEAVDVSLAMRKRMTTESPAFAVMRATRSVQAAAAPEKARWPRIGLLKLALIVAL